MVKAVIFARVSTDDGRQDNDRQLFDLRDLCAANGWEVAHEITERISGAKSNDERAGLQKLLKVARIGKVQKIVVTEVSRLGRSVSDGVQLIEELTKAGVSIYIQNIGMETLLHDSRPNYMFKPILLTLMGFAEMERELLRDRIKSGLAKARRKGKRLGRPKGSSQSDNELLTKYPAVVKELRDGHLSVRKIAKLHDVSPTTVQKVKAAMATV